MSYNSETIAQHLNRRVLLVEPHSDTAEVFSIFLELEGCRVKIAKTSEQALYAVETFKPDMLFSELRLPDEDGYTIARKIRSNQKRQITLVAITGSGRKQEIDAAKEAGFDHHVLKPAELSTLRTLIDTINATAMVSSEALAGRANDLGNWELPSKHHSPPACPDFPRPMYGKPFASADKNGDTLVEQLAVDPAMTP